MIEILKKYDVSADAIRVFRQGLGRFPLTEAEIQNLIPKSSNTNVESIITELINKKLILLIETPSYNILPHYLFLPPFAAIINTLSNANIIAEDNKEELIKTESKIEKFQDDLLQDIELISQELIEIISNQKDNSQTSEVLSEVEKNVKKFSQVLLTEVNELIAKLKEKSIVNEIDIERILRAVTQKITESEEVITNMFLQFRDIIKEMGSNDNPSIVESFKSFIRNLGASIDKRSTELFQNPNSSSIKNIQVVEKSLFNILTDYISRKQVSTDKVLPLYSIDKIKEII